MTGLSVLETNMIGNSRYLYMTCWILPYIFNRTHVTATLPVRASRPQTRREVTNLVIELIPSIAQA